MLSQEEYVAPQTPKQLGEQAYERRQSKFALAAFFGVFLTLWFGMCGYNLVDAFLINRAGSSTLGTVCKVERETTAESEGVRFDVAFQYGGREYQTSNRVLAGDTTYRVGERVPVKFLPNDPERAILDSEKEKYSGYLFFLIIGGVIGWAAWQMFRSL